MKKEDAKYILEAIEWMNKNTTVASADMETYGNLFMNSQGLLMDEVNGNSSENNPALHKQNVVCSASSEKKQNPHMLLWYKQGWSEKRIAINNDKYWQWEIDHNGFDPR